jgi:hypothetical protein
MLAFIELAPSTIPDLVRKRALSLAAAKGAGHGGAIMAVIGEGRAHPQFQGLGTAGFVSARLELSSAV